MGLSQKRVNILQRIRRNNKKLGRHEQTNIGYGSKYGDIKRMERTLKSKVKAKMSGYSVDEIPNIMSSKETQNLNQLAHAKKTGSVDMQADALNTIVRQNKDKIDKVQGQFAQLKGFGGADYIRHAFYKQTYKTNKKVVSSDLNYVYEAIYTKDMFGDYLKIMSKEANKYLSMHHLPLINKNMSEKEIINYLSNLDAKTKRIIFDSPKDLFTDEIDMSEEETFD